MKEKPRLTRVRVQWVQESSLEQNVLGENTSRLRPASPEPNISSAGAGFEPPPSFSDEEEFVAEADMLADPEYGLLAENGWNGTAYSEEPALQEQESPPEEEKHPLLNAVLVLIALYIVCGVAPLFIALFVSLRVFFWIEISGWAIIIAWVLIGVRPPFVAWYRERARLRKAQESGLLDG